MADEKYWYGYSGWPALKASLLKLATAESPPLLEALSQPNPDVRLLTGAFVERMVRIMRERMTRGASSKWAHGISLLGELDLLAAMIEGDPVLNGNSEGREVAPAAAFWQVYLRFLNRTRQRHGGTSEHRVTVWEMLDRISRRVAWEQEKMGRYVDRLSTEHLLAVQSRCREEWPTNKNVNVDFPTLRGYFEEFCEDARREFDPNVALIDQYQNLVFDTQDRPAVSVCLDRLSRHDPKLWDALLVKLEMHPTITHSSTAYASNLGISRYETEQRYESAAAYLRNCIEASLSMLLRR
ncbi:hypothetical protein D9M68_429160 [compost metagenome]